MRENHAITHPAHITYVDTFKPKLMQAGPILDEQGAICGSLFIVDMADRAEAERMAAGDPFEKAELFERTLIDGYRASVRDGVRG